MKKIKLGIAKKMAILAVVVNLLLCGTIGIALSLQVKQAFIEQGGEEAVLAGSLIVKGMNKDDVAGLYDEESRSTSHAKILSEIIEMWNVSEAENIYLLGKIEDDYYYLASQLDSEDEEISPLEEEFYNEVKPAFEGQAMYLPELQTSEWGSLLTAYVPIFDSQENVVAVLGIDYDAENVRTNVRNIVFYIISISGVMLVISLLLTLFMSRKMVNSIKGVNNKLEELVSSNGDLTKQITVVSNDEIGDIASRINELLRYIYVVIKNISDVSEKMKEHVSESRISIGESACEVEMISASMEELNAMVEETDSKVDSVTDSVHLLKGLLNEIYENIGNGKQLAESIKKNADDICRSAMVESDMVKEKTKEMTNSLQEKIKRTDEVEKIKYLTSEILGITKQTSLLALNASIESARAGEAGKGFAVVAGEISTLSENSAKTANEIQRISQDVIQIVQELSEEAERMLEFVSEKTIQGYDKLLAAGENYVSSSENITALLSSLYENSEKMEHGMEDVMLSVGAVSNASKESGLGIGQVTDATSKLSFYLKKNEEQAIANEEVMEQMQKEVGKFIIE